jgi:hypothetical protein
MAFKELCRRHRVDPHLDVGVLRAIAGSIDPSRGAEKRNRRRRNTEIFLEASSAGGWLPLRSGQDTVEYSTRLIGRLDPGIRDEVVVALRGKGLWIGLESAQHLGDWDAGGGRNPNADMVARQSLSFLTSQNSRQAALCAAVLRYGM